MARKIIAIASADYHLHNFPAFDVDGSRLSWSLKAAEAIYQAARKHNVPSLFAGDLFHNPKEVDNEVLVKTMQWYNESYEAGKIPFVAIDGNHDQKTKNTGTYRSSEYLKSFVGFDTFKHNPALENKMGGPGSEILFYNQNMGVWGIPYYTHEKDWLKEIKRVTKLAKGNGRNKILLLHGNAPNAKTPSGQVIDDCILPKDLDSLFKHWDLVLMGHIHRPQQLSKKVYMLGSPIHQNMGDAWCEMGYWEVYSDMSMIFRPLNDDFPEFIPVTEKQFIEYDNQNTKRVRDYIIHLEADGQDDGTTEQGEARVSKAFRNISNRKALSKAYCRAQGIKDKTKRKALTQILNEV